MSLPGQVTTPTARRVCVCVFSLNFPLQNFQTCESATKWRFQREAVTGRVFSEGCERHGLNMQLSEDLLSYFLFFFCFFAHQARLPPLETRDEKDGSETGALGWEE